MSCTALPKAAKPVWAKQLTWLPCLVVYVKFQFEHTTKTKMDSQLLLAPTSSHAQLWRGSEKGIQWVFPTTALIQAVTYLRMLTVSYNWNCFDWMTIEYLPNGLSGFELPFGFYSKFHNAFFKRKKYWRLKRCFLFHERSHQDKFYFIFRAYIVLFVWAWLYRSDKLTLNLEHPKMFRNPEYHLSFIWAFNAEQNPSRQSTKKGFSPRSTDWCGGTPSLHVLPNSTALNRNLTTICIKSSAKSFDTPKASQTYSLLRRITRMKIQCTNLKRLTIARLPWKSAWLLSHI